MHAIDWDEGEAYMEDLAKSFVVVVLEDVPAYGIPACSVCDSRNVRIDRFGRQCCAPCAEECGHYTTCPVCEADEVWTKGHRRMCTTCGWTGFAAEFHGPHLVDDGF